MNMVEFLIFFNNFVVLDLCCVWNLAIFTDHRLLFDVFNKIPMNVDHSVAFDDLLDFGDFFTIVLDSKGSFKDLKHRVIASITSACCYRFGITLKVDIFVAIKFISHVIVKIFPVKIEEYLLIEGNNFIPAFLNKFKPVTDRLFIFWRKFYITSNFIDQLQYSSQMNRTKNWAPIE